MILAQPPNGHPGPNIWIRIGAFNLALAITAGAFVGIGLRALLLAWMDRASDARGAAMRALKGILFLALGGYYLYVAWPMIIWDRPARIFFMLTALAPPIVAAIRYSKGGLRGTPGLTRRIVAWCLTLVLFLAAALTLLRAGFITLKGDRVAMLLALTGEVGVEIPRPVPGKKEQAKAVILHHVVLLLQDGTPAADLWIPADRLSFYGSAALFSHELNAMGFPNLYRIKAFGYYTADGNRKPSNTISHEFPLIGPLRLQSQWAPIQDAMLRAWPRADENGSPWWGVRIIHNQSPDYPLVNPDGTPLKKDFLFDITLDGIPTSRFTSPLEKK